MGRKCISGTTSFPAPSSSSAVDRSTHLPPAVLLVDTSAECLSRLSDTSTSVESIVQFGMRSAMLIDKRGRMPGREEQGRGGARLCVLRVTRCDAHTISLSLSLNLREPDNELEEDAQTEESLRIPGDLEVRK